MVNKAKGLVKKRACFSKAVVDEESDEPDELMKAAEKRVVEEEEEYGFMMTKVRRAFREYLKKAAQKQENIAIMQVAFRMQMDRKNTVSKFYELGMTDPMKTKKTIDDALSEISTFDFYTEVYPSSVMKSIIEAVKNKEKV
jgi:hypothetical protein